MPKESIWKAAKQLKQGDTLLKNNGESSIVKTIVTYEQAIELFDLSVKDSHNYFVSNSYVLTHNFASFVGISFAFGGGEIVFSGISAGLGLLGGVAAAIGLSKHKHKDKFEPTISIETQFGQTSFGGSPSPMPDPDDDKDKKKKEQNSKTRSIDNNAKAQFPEQKSQTKHLLTDRKGHMPDTPENRQQIIDLASNENNFLVKDIHGNKWYAEITPEGEQYWASVRDGIIQNCGKNQTPKTANPETGLCRNPFK